MALGRLVMVKTMIGDPNSRAETERSRTERFVSRSKVTALAAIMGLLMLAQPAAAQAGGGGGGGGAGNVCETQMGSFISAVTSSFGTIAIAGILIAILVGVAARPFVRSGGQASMLNEIMSKAFVGLVILILAIPIITWGLSFTPFAPTLSCIPFLGG